MQAAPISESPTSRSLTTPHGSVKARDIGANPVSYIQAREPKLTQAQIHEQNAIIVLHTGHLKTIAEELKNKNLTQAQILALILSKKPHQEAIDNAKKVLAANKRRAAELELDDDDDEEDLLKRSEEDDHVPEFTYDAEGNE